MQLLSVCDTTLHSGSESVTKRTDWLCVCLWPAEQIRYSDLKLQYTQAAAPCVSESRADLTQSRINTLINRTSMDVCCALFKRLSSIKSAGTHASQQQKTFSTVEAA